MIDAEEFLGRGGGDDSAGLEQNDARRQEQRFAQIVGDENDGLAETASQIAEFALEFGACNGIESAEGLVHQQNGRVCRESARDTDALTLPAGKLMRATGGEVPGLQPDEGEEFVDTRGDAIWVPFFEGRDQADIFCHREMREQACILNHVADAATESNGVPVGGSAALNHHLPTGGQ